MSKTLGQTVWLAFEERRTRVLGDAIAGLREGETKVRPYSSLEFAERRDWLLWACPKQVMGVACQAGLRSSAVAVRGLRQLSLRAGAQSLRRATIPEI